ncbi:MAG: MgtC/SapB family protein [Oscillochloris sp.]|nr:MgtC/SapB family protein [Oscillochloris sp.]
METFFDFNLSALISQLIKIGIAFLLTLPIALEREASTGMMGLRTFPLVAVASCGYALIAQSVFNDGGAEARIMQGLITGIGFIGGGAILKQNDMVYGTATAASIWTTGAIGAAAAYGEYEIAVLISVLDFITLRLLKPLRRVLGTDNQDDDPEERSESHDLHPPAE